jgi:hypothetical protein
MTGLWTSRGLEGVARRVGVTSLHDLHPILPVRAATDHFRALRGRPRDVSLAAARIQLRRHDVGSLFAENPRKGQCPGKLI